MRFIMLLAAGIQAPSALGGPATVGELATRVTNLLLGIAGVVSVIFIIIGGIQYASSAGNEQGTTKAKDTITNAVIGLVISVLAFAIVNFLLGSVFR